MKRMWQAMVIGGLMAVFATGAVFAQGWCRGGGGCRMGQPGNGPGCWLTRVTPTDPQQKAFVEQVGKLQAEIVEEQTALRVLQKNGASAEAIAAQQAVVDKQRTQFRELMTKNSALVQQIAQQYGGRGWCGGRGAWCCAACPTGTGGPACGLCPGCPWAR